MKIYPIRAFKDNYIWAIVQGQQAIIIDAGETKPVLDFLTKHQLTPMAMLITHHHDDHIGGVASLQQMFPDMRTFAHLQHGVSCETVDEGDVLELMGMCFDVWRTAGHTDTHLSYVCQMAECTHVFCGDTLFSGGCGRVFTGTIEQLYASLMRFAMLPEGALFYPAHEYTHSNLKFGQYIEPDNLAISKRLAEMAKLVEQGQPSLPTHLALERQINVFLRAEQPSVIAQLRKLDVLSNDTSPLACFAALRQLKNQF